MRKKLAQAFVLVTLSCVAVLGMAAYLLRRAILQERILYRTPAFGTIQPKLNQTLEGAKEDILFLAGTAAYSYREIHDEITAVTLSRREAVARLPAVALAEKFGRVVGILGILDSQRARARVADIRSGRMAHALGIRTVAEGVETREQLEFLREHGCDAVQGDYFSRPLPAEELAPILKAGFTFSGQGIR